jgi:hypothetical protein
MVEKPRSGLLAFCEHSRRGVAQADENDRRPLVRRTDLARGSECGGIAGRIAGARTNPDAAASSPTRARRGRKHRDRRLPLARFSGAVVDARGPG